MHPHTGEVALVGYCSVPFEPPNSCSFSPAVRLRANIRAAEDASLQMRVLEVRNLIMLPQVSQSGAECHSREVTSTAAFQGSAWSQLETAFLHIVASLLGFRESVC